jgi:hypothetical protein
MKTATGRPYATGVPLSRKFPSKKVALYAILGFLLVGSALFGFLPKAAALTTLNPGDVPTSSGGGTDVTSNQHVFYANGYWWTFWGSTGGTFGIYYESSPDGKTWSTPTTFSNPNSPNGGDIFDTYVVGNTVYYAVAPTAGATGTKFWFGAATLGAGTVVFTVNNAVHNLAAARIGTTTQRVSIAVDGNGYLTIAVTTSNAGATAFYVDVFQCQVAIAGCAAGTWYTTEYTLATTLNADLTTISLLALSNGGTYYDALVYDDAASTGGAAGYGPMKVFIGTSTAGSLPLPAVATCIPASQFYNDGNFGTTEMTNTVYVVNSYFGSGTYSFSCPVGGPVSAEDPISASSYVASLGVSGTTLVAVFPTGANVQSWTSVNGGASWVAGPNVAQATETNPPFNGNPMWVDISPVAYTIGSQTYMGVYWIDGNYVRFATLSLTNFPVSVSLALTEYQLPQTAWYPLTPANEFAISYTLCTNLACSTTTPATVDYGSCSALQGSCTTATPAYGCASGATAGCYMTIPNVQSYSAITIAAKSTGSTANEQWCLNINTPDAGTCAATVIGASDGIPATVSVGGVASNNFVQYAYYDLLSEPTKYTVVPAAPSPPSVPTLHAVTAPASSLFAFTPTTDNYNLPAASTIQWIAKNSTDFAAGAIAGVASDQWAANPANIAWTVVTANQVNPNIIYYHQFLNNYVITDGNFASTGQTFDGTGAFVISGVQYGQAVALASFAPISPATTFSADLWSDANQVVMFPAQATGTPVATRWQAAAGSVLTTGALSSGTTTAGTSPTVMADTAGGWTANQWVGDYLEYTSGPAKGELLAITANTPTTVTTVAFSPVPTAGGGDTFTIGTVITTGVGVNPSGYSVTYWKQFEQSLAYSTNDGSVPTTVPAITFSSYGVSKAHNLNTTTNNDWIDACPAVGCTSVASVPQSIAGGAGEAWNTLATQGNYNGGMCAAGNVCWEITNSNVVTNPSITYYHQFSQKLIYATSDVTVPTTVPKITYTSYGVVKAHMLNTTVNVDWVDANGQATVPATINGAVGEEWATATTSWTITGTNVVTNPISYVHQYLISFVAAPAGAGVVNPSGSNIWEPATSAVHGIPPIAIAGTPIPGYSFTTWGSSSGSITFASNVAVSTTATLNGPGTITGNFQIVTGLSFLETGIALDGVHAWSVTLTTWPAAYVGPTTVTATTQAIVIAGAPLGTYVYTVPSPQSWGGGTQYLVTTGAGGTVTLTVGSPSSTESVTFQAQYFLTMLQNPANSGTVTANGSPLNQWFTAGTPITLLATPNVGITFSTWTGITCNPGCGSASQSIIMTGPTGLTATANFIVPLSLSLTPPTETAGVGTQVSTTVTATGGSGTINLTNGALPAGITLIYTSNGFAASATGASSTMIVTIAPNAPFGVYTWSVTATDVPVGTMATTTYQLSVISPTVSTIGFTTSAYAITYGSQSALFFAGGHWFAVYSDGTNLIYRSSTDATGTNWNAQSIISTGITQGYSFAIGTNGLNVYLALMTSSYTGGFYFVQGVVAPATSSITWGACPSSCSLGPIQMQKLSIAPGLTAEGSPSVFVDTSATCSTSSPTGVCVWVTVPALDANLMWHVEIAYLTNSWTIPAAANCVAQGDVCLHQVYTGPDSQVHSELYSMPDAVAAIFVVGNTPDLPHITVFNHLDTTAMTFCAVVSAACPLGAAPAGTWIGIKIYEQQSQGVVLPAATGTDVIFFAALAQNGLPANGADVQFYTFNYNSAVPASSTFSAPTTLAITSIPQNAVVNHSWHISMTFGGTSLYIAYGVDDFLAFQVGTVGSGPTYTVVWSSPIQVPDVAGLVGGVTISYSGSTVGLVWVQTSGDRYAVKFAVI